MPKMPKMIKSEADCGSGHHSLKKKVFSFFLPLSWNLTQKPASPAPQTGNDNLDSAYDMPQMLKMSQQSLFDAVNLLP